MTKEVSDGDQGTCIERCWDGTLCKVKLPIEVFPKVMLRPTPQVFQGVELGMKLGEEVEDIAFITAFLDTVA
jgi:hypothetical protein